jgi:hypothetical protein
MDPTARAWAEEITERARRHWTEERLASLGERTLLLAPVEAAPLLRALGIARDDGSIPPDRIRKYRQVNHMVAAIGPSLVELSAAHEELDLLDAACGKSYLSLLVAWVLAHRFRRRVRVLGIDRNAALVEEVRRIAALAGLGEVVRPVAGLLEATDARARFAEVFGRAPHFHALLALHACDTATDDAIALGVALDATLIAVVPCCQAELSRRWAEAPGGAFEAIHGSPHLRREVAAHLTDAMRMLLLRRAGYEASALELVPTEHQPKNTLLRAMRRPALDGQTAGADEAYRALVAATGGAGLALADRLADRAR